MSFFRKLHPGIVQSCVEGGIGFRGLLLCDFIGPRAKCLIQAPLQTVPLERFALLEQGDVLFVDSTHVAKTGSDVNYLFFEIFPRLNKGVMVHIHDIFYPFDYPAEWIEVEGRSWNEAFVLRAFLQFNDAFEIVFFNHFASLAFHEEMSRILPDFMRNSGGSIWLRKVR